MRSVDEQDGVLPTAELGRLIGVIAAQRDREAFTQVYRHYAPRLKSFFLRGGMAANMAEELAQETMLQVWRKAYLFDPARAGPGTWIFTIAKNLRIDALRRQRVATDDDADLADAPDDAPSGEAVLLASEREARVRSALASLSAEQAKIVQLSFFGDKAHAEIARELGIPLGTVKSRVRLALGKLRALLEPIR
ncbi:sigma-70 family RNA polymerase sigma factor [Aquabacter spiritensis]|uniref:RNA polymerase sigma factor n=1 Tax=Aquabacter spiritensis TaxID=933073 RepID=A0A4R3M2J6_9HYPH|nr:sigma-70 family RNA polymerase sigma factor [Aquabacter spiritensis]TCT06926.1 RNA polymerase sigma-70 factor (ECF subfamily) [Aquabacter spiritensis]